MQQIQDLFRDLPTLETPRLTLRKIRLEDLSDQFQLLSDEAVTEFLPLGPHRTPAETEKFIRLMLDLYAKGEVSPWAIAERDSDRLIGNIGFSSWHTRHAKAEVYYYLAREAWGKGLMAEALSAVVRFGFERMGLNRLEAAISPDNLASQRVAAKVGMKSEGLLRESHQLRGVFRDHLMYALLRREWVGHA